MAYCFAWDQNFKGQWGCRATTIDCDGQDEHCPFYKTMAQHKADREKANERIADLPEYQQESISDKYYSGDKPWRNVAPKLDSIINNAVAEMANV